MTTATTPAPSLVLASVDWRTYTRLLHAFAGHPGVRLTYDRGTLEITTLSHPHEAWNRLLAHLVDVLLEEMNLPARAGGSTTFRRRRRRRGIEPDSCWWIASEPSIRGKPDLDFRVDPPPDLTLEVDLSSSSLDRLGICAALRIPEVWRFDGQALVFLHLQADGTYTPQPQSRSFPTMTPGDVQRFLALHPGEDHTSITRQFRAWVRSQLPPRTP